MADSTQIKTEKLLKYGKKQLTEKGVETQATTIREVLDDISNVKAEEPTQYGAYNIEVIEKDDGTQELHITDAVEKPVDRLQWKCDAIQSLEYEFRNYLGTNENGDLSTIVCGLDTSSVTNMDYAFMNCKNLTNLDLSNWNVNNVVRLMGIFEGCNALSDLDLRGWDTSNVQYMANVFYGCKVLKSIDLSSFDTSNVTRMDTMFGNCKALTELNLSSFNTSKSTMFSYMFSTCEKLKTILGTIDVIKASNLNSMFNNCYELTTVTLKNIKKALTIGSGTSYGTLLDDPTVINTAKELWDLTGATSQKLTVSTPTDAKFDTIYVKLITATDEMIANDPNINSKKPCEVCASTDEGAMTLREYIISKNWTIAK